MTHFTKTPCTLKSEEERGEREGAEGGGRGGRGPHYDNYGRKYFWHRRTRRTAWEIPESAILRMKGMRKRKKKKLRRGSSFSRSSRVRIRRCGLGRALVLRGFLTCSLPYCCCGRARRFRQWHTLEWFGWLLLACGYIYSDMLENSCGIVSLLLVLLVMMHIVFKFPVVVQRPIPMVFSSEDHNYSPVAPQHGDRCPCCTGRAGSLASDSLLYGNRCSPVEYKPPSPHPTHTHTHTHTPSPPSPFPPSPPSSHPLLPHTHTHTLIHPIHHHHLQAFHSGQHALSHFLVKLQRLVR